MNWTWLKQPASISIHVEGKVMHASTVEVYEGRRALQRRKQWRWRFTAENGNILAHSGESYNNVADLIEALAVVIGVPVSDLVEMQWSHAPRSIYRAGRLVLVIIR